MNRIRYILFFLLIVPNFVLALFSCSDRNRQSMTENVGSREIKKVKDIVIYEDTSFYSAFPSIVKNDDADFIVAFRRARQANLWGEKKQTYGSEQLLVMVRSRWGNVDDRARIDHAHPFGGRKTPCLLRLRDGTLLCTSYGWSFINQDEIDNLKTPYFDNRGSVLGGYPVRSDGGKRGKALFILHTWTRRLNLTPWRPFARVQ